MYKSQSVTLVMHIGDPGHSFLRQVHGFKTTDDLQEVRRRVEDMVLSCYDCSKIAFSGSLPHVIGLYWIIGHRDVTLERVALFWDRMINAAQFGKEYS